MQVAIVDDWLTGMRGGEKVLEVFCELFPPYGLFFWTDGAATAFDRWSYPWRGVRPEPGSGMA